MIKPFTITNVVTEADGRLGVSFSVRIRTLLDIKPADGVTKFWEGGREFTQKNEGYIAVPAGEDVDAYVFQALKEAGWVQ